MEISDKSAEPRELSCTFCGPGTWSVWEVVTEDGVFFVCDRHHVEMCEANMIQLEKGIGEVIWKSFKAKNVYE